MVGEMCVEPFTVSITMSKSRLSTRSKLMVEHRPAPPFHLRCVCRAFNIGVQRSLQAKFDGTARISQRAIHVLRRGKVIKQPWVQETKEVEITGHIDLRIARPLSFISFPLIERIVFRPRLAQWVTQIYFLSEDVPLDLFEAKMCEETQLFYEMLKDPMAGFRGLRHSLHSGIKITVIYERKVSDATMLRISCELSADGPGLRSAKRIHLLPWKE